LAPACQHRWILGGPATLAALLLGGLLVRGPDGRRGHEAARHQPLVLAPVLGLGASAAARLRVGLLEARVRVLPGAFVVVRRRPTELGGRPVGEGRVRVRRRG